MKKTFWWGIGFILLVAIVLYFMSKPGFYDEFAQCLTDKGVKMYGAYWCPHCQAQKALFEKHEMFERHIDDVQKLILDGNVDFINDKNIMLDMCQRIYKLF